MITQLTKLLLFLIMLTVRFSVICCLQASDCNEKSAKVNLHFLIDGSRSVGNTNFGSMKTWVKVVSNKFDVTTGNFKIGFIQYSLKKFFQIHIRLGQYRDRASYNDAVDRIKLQGWSTYTADAIIRAVRDFNTNGDRDAHKILILVTDGRANDRLNLRSSVRQLNAAKVYPIVVGVGDIDRMQLKQIAGKSKVHILRNYASLLSIADTVEKTICEVINPSATTTTSSESTVTVGTSAVAQTFINKGTNTSSVNGTLIGIIASVVFVLLVILLIRRKRKAAKGKPGSDYYYSKTGSSSKYGKSGSDYYSGKSGSGYYSSKSGSGSGYYSSKSGSGSDYYSSKSGSGYYSSKSGSGYYSSKTGSGSDYSKSGSSSGYYSNYSKSIPENYSSYSSSGNPNYTAYAKNSTISYSDDSFQTGKDYDSSNFKTAS